MHGNAQPLGCLLMSWGGWHGRSAVAREIAWLGVPVDSRHPVEPQGPQDGCGFGGGSGIWDKGLALG